MKSAVGAFLSGCPGAGLPVQATGEVATVYNIAVEVLHDYYVAGDGGWVLAHNASLTGWIRPDLLLRDAEGNFIFVEVKNGLKAPFTKNQRKAIPTFGSDTELRVFVDAARALGEDQAAEWVQTCSLGEQAAMCVVSSWLQLDVLAVGVQVPHWLAEGFAPVFVLEGVPRPLARKRRKKIERSEFELADRMCGGKMVAAVPQDSVIPPQLRDFWMGAR